MKIYLFLLYSISPFRIQKVSGSKVLDEVIQLALVDRVNADLCLHLLCLHSLRGVFSLGILSGKKSQPCLLTAMDIPPPLYPFAAYPSPLHDRESRAKKWGGHATWTGQHGWPISRVLWMRTACGETNSRAPHGQGRGCRVCDWLVMDTDRPDTSALP